MTGLEGVRVGVVCGGFSAEAEVSRSSGAMVASALRNCGAACTVLEPSPALVRLIENHEVDVIFPALHGPLGEDGRLQGFLEFFGMPYVGSGVRASACANDKVVAKSLFRDAGLPVAREFVLDREREQRESLTSAIAAFGPSVVVKPVREGSAVGVSFADNVEEVLAAAEGERSLGRQVLIEERVYGHEVTAGVLDVAGPQPLPIVQIEVPTGAWYDYEHRYTPGLSTHRVPAPLPDKVYRAVEEIAVGAHRVLGCRHLSRADFIVGHDGRIVLLEVNTMPGMTPTSLYPDAARHAGHSFEQLVASFVRDALKTPAPASPVGVTQP